RRMQAAQIQSPKSRHYRAQRRRIEPRAHQDLTERTDVVGDWTPAHERRLERRGAATGKRIIDGVARGGQALDEEPRQLGLEHRTIADLVQAVRLALLGRPELVHEIAEARAFEFGGRLSGEREGANGVEELFTSHHSGGTPYLQIGEQR